jgi:hypothetical protein
MNKEECQTADWRTVGFHDAAAGRTADTINDHRQACAEYGVAPNLDRYLEGRKAGLKEYCRASRGYQEGLSGHEYGGVCPSNLEKDFKAGYEAGRRIFAIEDQARDQERALRDRERQLKTARKKADEAQSVIVSSNDANARARALLDLQSRNRERSDLEREIDFLSRDIQRLRRDAAQARSGTDARFQ